MRKNRNRYEIHRMVLMSLDAIALMVFIMGMTFRAELPVVLAVSSIMAPIVWYVVRTVADL